MNVVIDQDKWLKAITGEELLPVGLMTAAPEFLGERLTPDPVAKQAALELTFRIVPEATEDELAVRTSLLLRGLSQREIELGGEGLELDVDGSVFAPDRIVLRLIPSKADGATRRVAVLVDEMHAAGKRAAGDEKESLAAKINRNFKTTLPESALKQLEAAAVA